jgi:exo-1,4-beta-D-glucosaminidase
VRILLTAAVALVLLSSLAYGQNKARAKAKAAASSPGFALKTWRIQSSAKTTGGGDALSRSGFRDAGWMKAGVPSTVVAAMVANKMLPDPDYGMNLRSYPGMTYDIGKNFSNEPMSADSPFAVAWWYRTEFRVPAAMAHKNVALHFDGINYRANIWLNGEQIAKADDVAGAWRTYEFDITKQLKPGANALAVEIFPPKETDLAITFVDWNPMPPDKGMGLWRDVYLTASGPVVIRNPFVVSEVDLPGGDNAHLTIVADVANHSDKPLKGMLKAHIENISISQPVELAANESKEVKLTPEQFKQLNVAHPRLWWPRQMGAPNLYKLHLEFNEGGKISDASDTQFGIRQITSELTPTNGRLFKVNGKNILIRGGGWSPDMLLRYDPKRVEQEMAYTLDMGLNTIRQEGKLEPQHFFDAADRLGILVMSGWCCCDFWEQWPKWQPETYKIAEQSLRDQIKRIRSHPSLLVWLNGSDNPPTPEVEKMYLGVLSQCDWPNPVLSSATGKPAASGTSGVKMNGPYEYVAPAYWTEDKDKFGGAWGFSTEISPGPAVPVIESMRKMLPKEHLWPVDDWWNFHAGGGEFKDIHVYSDALNKRYGQANSAEEFTAKAQLMNYEGIRAMFEGYSRNKYKSTGVIQWMLNNAWPSVIWHLYDWYLQPGGGYFGAKKADEAIHPVFSYDDRSIWLVNSTYKAAPGITVSARVLDLNAQEKWTQQQKVDLASDGTQRLFEVPQPEGISGAYFLVLTAKDAGGKQVGSNFYWLSTTQETLDFSKSEWYMTPTAQFADFTSLSQMPKVRVKASARTVRSGARATTTVTLENPGKNIAFFIRLKLDRTKGGDEILPVLWQDNYISLLPGEKRTITADFATSDLGKSEPVLEVSGVNVE